MDDGEATGAPATDEPTWEPEPEFDVVYPLIRRRLRRLIAECGWQNVVHALAAGLPDEWPPDDVR
jgi:hypothetical protein